MSGVALHAVTDKSGSFTLGAFVPLTPVEKLGEIHIFTLGEWEGHPQGPFKITPETFSEILAEFNAQTNPIPIDYDHSAPKHGDTKAAGWIHGLEIRGDQLWATEVEWTPAAAKMIADGEYKFCSPWLQTARAKDRVTGEERGAKLRNVALTNLPFFDGHEAITLSQLTAEAKANEASPMDEQVTKFLEAVAASAGVDIATVIAALSGVADQVGALVRQKSESAPAEEVEAKDPPPAAEGEEEKPAPEEDEEKRLSEIERRAKDNEVLASVVAAVKALEARLDSQSKTAESEAAAVREARVSADVACGALFETERADALHILASEGGAERYARVYGNRKGLSKAVPIGVTQAGAEPKPAPEALALSEMTAAEVQSFNTLRRLRYSESDAMNKIKAQRRTAN